MDVRAGAAAVGLLALGCGCTLRLDLAPQDASTADLVAPTDTALAIDEDAAPPDVAEVMDGTVRFDAAEAPDASEDRGAPPDRGLDAADSPSDTSSEMPVDTASDTSADEPAPDVAPTRCAAGETRCGDACVRLDTDRSNCGACGTACRTDFSCTNGACGEWVRDVTVGSDHTCAVRVSGQAVCWGYNVYGQLGDGSTRHRVLAGPVTDLTDAESMVAGVFHTCARRSGDRGLRCWGWNNAGQLGDGTNANSAVPVAVVGLTDVSSFSLGLSHTCAVSVSGLVRCWGFNERGQLGIGDMDDRFTPSIPVVGLSGVSEVSGGSSHTCARRGGAVYCWGEDFNGTLGRGVMGSPSPTPVRVVDIDDALSLASGVSHNCVVRAGGTVWCWGYNFNGELGDGTRTSSSRPVEVTGLVNIRQVAVAPGGMHTCARDALDRVWCWGNNSCGQLGDGTTVSRNRPVEVHLDGLEVRTLRAGVERSCAVTNGGRSLWCWGNNREGFLGTGMPYGCDTSPRRVVGVP